MHLTRNKNTTQNDFLSYIFIYLEQKKKKVQPSITDNRKKKKPQQKQRALTCNRGSFSYKCHFYSRVKLS